MDLTESSLSIVWKALLKQSSPLSVAFFLLKDFCSSFWACGLVSLLVLLQTLPNYFPTAAGVCFELVKPLKPIKGQIAVDQTANRPVQRNNERTRVK